MLELFVPAFVPTIAAWDNRRFCEVKDILQKVRKNRGTPLEKKSAGQRDKPAPGHHNPSYCNRLQAEPLSRVKRDKRDKPIVDKSIQKLLSLLRNVLRRY